MQRTRIRRFEDRGESSEQRAARSVAFNTPCRAPLTHRRSREDGRGGQPRSSINHNLTISIMSLNRHKHKYNFAWMMSDTASSFLQSGFVGAMFGAVTPYHHSQPWTLGKHIAPFSSPPSIAHYACLLGSITAVQRLTSNSLAVLRNKDDALNNTVGCVSAYYYAARILSSRQKLIWNNRMVGGLIATSFFYVNSATNVVADA